MNNENKWTKQVRYFKLYTKPRNLAGSLKTEVDNFLLEALQLKKLQYDIDWENDYQIREDTFKQFAHSKFIKTLAYRSEIMSIIKADNYLTKFLDLFKNEKLYFTNYDDLDYIIDEWKTIVNYESQKSFGYGSFGFTENVFDCALIVIDPNKIGAILISDND